MGTEQPGSVLEVVVLDQEDKAEACQWRDKPDAPPSCSKPPTWLAMMTCCGESRLWCQVHRQYILGRPVMHHRCRACGARGTVEELMMWIPYDRSNP